MKDLLKEQQAKRYKFLTEQTDLFKHFINAKMTEKEESLAAILEEAKAQKQHLMDEEESQDHRHTHIESLKRKKTLNC